MKTKHERMDTLMGAIVERLKSNNPNDPTTTWQTLTDEHQAEARITVAGNNRNPARRYKLLLVEIEDGDVTVEAEAGDGTATIELNHRGQTVASLVTRVDKDGTFKVWGSGAQGYKLEKTMQNIHITGDGWVGFEIGGMFRSE
jgi:hypothetical protein